MPTANYGIDDTFPVQFVWKLPQGDYIRAIFEARVVSLDPTTDKYMVTLVSLKAGRQEDAFGEPRPKEQLSKPYWGLVGRLMGRTVQLAYEAENGRPLQMRLTTLTGEHNFFFRHPPTPIDQSKSDEA